MLHLPMPMLVPASIPKLKQALSTPDTIKVSNLYKKTRHLMHLL
jgi:hypothetical protein